MEDINSFVNETLSYYSANADAFWQGTKDHDVFQNYAALQTRLPERSNMRILDLGCGPGRDLLHFKNRHHIPTGLDGCPEFCEMARQYSSCEVLNQNFSELDLPANEFHGIFANASLFHVPKKDLLRVLRELYNCLKDGGILFSSNPRGDGEQFDGKRYGHYMEFDVYKDYAEKAGFKIVDHYYRPTGWPREHQTWLAVVCQK
ncbi:MAG: class I SAM-dependent methyltransferase [Lentisphaeraceae bacterium]|nr:class I SAM-dependent methyltransferase [Lentisphaeraceae bacterium]